MSNIDRQRVAAVRKLEGMGYTFAAGDWMHPANDAVALALHALLVARADALMGKRANSRTSPTPCKLMRLRGGLAAGQTAARGRGPRISHG